jgi:hypothetical protein
VQYLEVVNYGCPDFMAFLRVSDDVLVHWRTDKATVQGLGADFVEWIANKPRPLYIQFSNLTAREHGLFLLLKGYVEFHTPYILEETPYMWAWTLRDPGLRDLM